MVLDVGEKEKVLPQLGLQMGLLQKLNYIGTNAMGLVKKNSKLKNSWIKL